MRRRKRLSTRPHPRSVFAEQRPRPRSELQRSHPRSVTAERRSRDSLVQSKQHLRAATVRIGHVDVIVVEIEASLVADVFEAQLALSAIELTCGQPAVLWVYEPCGCRELFGRREHIGTIDAMPAESLVWRHVVIDFARPILPRRTVN